MHRKELMLRTGALVLSASLAMSSPIAVFADGDMDAVPTVSVFSGDVDNSESDGATEEEEDLTDEVITDVSLPEDGGTSGIISEEGDSEEGSLSDITEEEEEQLTDEVIPEESLPEDGTSGEDIPVKDVSEKDHVPDDSEQEEKEVIEGDVKQEFTVTVLDHFADSVETREYVFY